MPSILDFHANGSISEKNNQQQTKRSIDTGYCFSKHTGMLNTNLTQSHIKKQLDGLQT